MLNISVAVSGGTVASEMASDAEEFACFLEDMAIHVNSYFFEETAECVGPSERAEVLDFLRNLIREIEASA